LFALPSVLLAGWLAAADKPALLRDRPDSGTPSTFDYLVLASLADSPQLHAMAGFRASARRLEPKAAHEPVRDHQLKAEDWRR
jgi:hypothetical protein